MRLYIYNTKDKRHGRHDENEGIAGMAQALDTHKLPAASIADLHSSLAQLVSGKKTFNRVLWMTHGSPGSIYFGDEQLSQVTLLGQNFTNKGYDKLFPNAAKMYFSGCNVAGDGPSPGTRDIGWQFLEAAGQAFLKNGGYTMGWTSTGYGWDDWFTRGIMGGHTLHFSGDVRHVTFAKGGRVLERLSYDGGFWSASIYEQMKVVLKLKEAFPGG